MKKNYTLSFNTSNFGRPQILLIGNGLERGCAPTIPDPKGVTNQLSWDELVATISVKGCAELSEKENKKIPFPLKYSLLSVPASAPTRMDKTMIDDEEHRLQSAMNKLSQHSTWRLDELKKLGADHILTTNYSYGLEQSFFSGKDFFKTTTRSKYRFNLNPEINNISNKPVREVNYRMHTGYLAHNEDNYIKTQADKVVYTSQEYTSDCMFKRNRHLVNHSSLCICYLSRNSGGTAYTVDYSIRNNLKIENIANLLI